MSLLLRNTGNNTKYSQKDTENKKWLRKNQDKVSVELINLTLGNVIFKDPKTGELITWNGSADVKVVSMEVVFSMLSSGKALLRDAVLGVSDIFYSGKKEMTLKNLIGAIGLDNIYSLFEYDIKNMDGIIINSTSDEFEDLCNKLPRGAVERLAERFCFLRNNGYVDSRGKEGSLKDIIGSKQVFEIPEMDD